MRFFLLFLPLSLCAITTTLEFEDEREAASRAEITNEIASATNSLSQSAAAAHQSLASEIASATNALAAAETVAHQSLAAQIVASTNGLISAESDPHALLRDAYSITTAGLITDWLIDNNLYGGVRIRYSSRNLDNYTAYAYNGIAVRRNNATQDYLFDAAHSNGIVRRAELDDYQPKGDYATNGNYAAKSDLDAFFPKTGGRMQNSDRDNESYISFAPTYHGVWGRAGPCICLVSTAFSTNRVIFSPYEIYRNGNSIQYPSASGTLALTSDIASATNATHQSLASSLATATNATLAAANAYADAAVAALPAPPTYAATNTTAVLAYNYGKETVAIPDGATLSADLSNWRDGEQCFIVLDPQGSYTPDASVAYNGYGLWPTNTALCVAWRYGATVYVNPVKIME